MNDQHAGNGPDERLSGPLLRALREEVGLSQNAARKAAGVGQSSLSRTENEEARPTPQLVAAVLGVYVAAEGTSLTPARVEQLVAQARAMATELTDVRLVLQAGAAHHFQKRIRDAERDAALVRSFHPSVVIGTLQTRAYASTVFTPDELLTEEDAALSLEERLERGVQFREPGRQWDLIQTEQALRWPVRDYALQAEQLEHIVAVAALPHVTYRLIPLDTVAPSPAPVNGFHLYDDVRVLVGTESGSLLSADPDQLRMYAKRFLELSSVALSHPESVDLVADLARRYRALAAR